MAILEARGVTKKFGGLANSSQEPWKMPLPQFIEHLYRKSFKTDRPATVISIEEKIERDRFKKAEKSARKRAAAAGTLAQPGGGPDPTQEKDNP